MDAETPWTAADAFARLHGKPRARATSAAPESLRINRRLRCDIEEVLHTGVMIIVRVPGKVLAMIPCDLTCDVCLDYAWSLFVELQY